jgi:hypothetical protein
MPIDQYRISPLQALEALMAAENIPCDAVSGDISNVTQAVQYLRQKMKASGKWRTANRVAHTAVVAATAIGVGVATAGIGAAVIAGAAIGAATGLIQSEVIDKTSGRAVNKVLRGMKSLWKSACGTKGVHRGQAADVLVTYGIRYIHAGRPSAGDRLGSLAYRALVILAGSDSALTTLVNSDNDTDHIKQIVADFMRTE